jgi:hypothetical protein
VEAIVTPATCTVVEHTAQCPLGRLSDRHFQVFLDCATWVVTAEVTCITARSHFDPIERD